MTVFPRQTLIDTVNRSPEAVSQHDRRAWIGLFARQSVVEDPVGAAPHVSGVFDGRAGRRGKGALERFFDTFIAPNTIRFHVERDVVCENHVVRDLSIEIRLSEAVQVKVPMHLLYELRAEDGEPRIARLAAHWELWPMVRQVLDKGRAALPVLWQLSLRMLKIQGLGGTLGFARGFLGIGKQGRETVQRFVEALNAAQPVKLFDLFSATNRGIRFPVGTPAIDPDQFVKRSAGPILHAEKLLVAGYTVSATVRLEHEGRSHQGVAFFEFDSGCKRLHGVDFYWDDEGSSRVE